MKSAIALVGVLSLVLASPLQAANKVELACPDFPFLRPTTGPLGLLNCDFHHEYEARVNELIQSFGAPNGRPVILNLGGTLVLKYNGTSKTVDITPDTYQEVKVFGHTALATVLAVVHETKQPLTEQTLTYLHSLQDSLQQAKQLLPSFKVNANERQTLTELATIIQDFLQDVLDKKQCSDERLQAFAKQTKPYIFAITMIASQSELDALDKAIDPWLAAMKPEDKANIAIVVETAHQAVDGELSVQYFVKKLGPRYRVRNVAEDGLVVLQDAFDEQSALKLLARHYLDREISSLMFDDPTYLQRDALSEAGKKLLDERP